jgi:hypothetical protein
VKHLSQARDAEIGKEYDDLSPEDLKKALKTVLLYADEVNDDTTAELDRIMAALREKEPLERECSAEESWAIFQAEHREELSQLGVRKNDTDKEVVPDRAVSGQIVRRKSTRVLLRVALAATLVVVLLTAAAVTAGAMGFDLWGWAPKWIQEDLRFVTEEPGAEDVQDIPTALAALGIDEPLYPHWLPEDMKRENVEIQFEPVLLYEAYQGNDRALSITIIPSLFSDTAVYQRSEPDPEEYIAGNTIHYIYSDVNHLTATWYIKDYTASIVGDVSIAEMKLIIDSIYEVRN